MPRDGRGNRTNVQHASREQLPTLDVMGLLPIYLDVCIEDTARWMERRKKNLYHSYFGTRS